jgi:DNA-binding helix-hairpin-helix protein with protein kinase domain
MSELKEGDRVRLCGGETCRVLRELGRGGQGIVYAVDYNGSEYALKWYTCKNSEAFCQNLADNAAKGAPNDHFIWPMAVTEFQNGSFGYLMRLRPKDYVDMSKFILVTAQFANVEAQLNACMQLVRAFLDLHREGLSYQDMNDGNFFINPKTGDVLICDNDNVAPNNAAEMGILGKAGYMAPEIVQGVSRPNKYTDYHSLAVCLFILIYMNRPFEGKWYLSCPCDNDPEMAKHLFGYEAVFIMDPVDRSNAPDPALHKNVIRRWNIYPKILRDAFCRTFSKEAILNGTKRVSDKEWRDILLQVQANLVRCPKCGHTVFADPNNSDCRCVYCDAPLSGYRVLRAGKFTVPLLANKKIYESIVNGTTNYDKEVGATIVKGGEVGLVNTSDELWTVTLPSGTQRTVAHGDSMPARTGFKIKFGNLGETAEIN